MILDTNAYSSFMLKDPKVEGVLEQSEEVWMSAIVLGELHAGFGAGRRYDGTRTCWRVPRQGPRCRCWTQPPRLREIYGKVKADLARAGTPIPMVDVWIAAQAFLDRLCRRHVRQALPESARAARVGTNWSPNERGDPMLGGMSHE